MINHSGTDSLEIKQFEILKSLLSDVVKGKATMSKIYAPISHHLNQRNQMRF